MKSAPHFEHKQSSLSVAFYPKSITFFPILNKTFSLGKHFFTIKKHKKPLFWQKRLFQSELIIRL